MARIFSALMGHLNFHRLQLFCPKSFQSETQSQLCLLALSSHCNPIFAHTLLRFRLIPHRRSWTLTYRSRKVSAASFPMVQVGRGRSLFLYGSVSAPDRWIPQEFSDGSDLDCRRQFLRQGRSIRCLKCDKKGTFDIPEKCSFAFGGNDREGSVIVATELSFDVDDLFGGVRDKIFGENSWNHEDGFVKSIQN